MLSTCKSAGTRFIPVIALSRSLFSDTLFILASALWLFLFTLSGLAAEAFYIPLLVTQYPAITIITRHDALVSLFPFRLLVLCLSVVCLAFYLACFNEPCVFWTLEEVHYLGLWLSCSARCLLEPRGHLGSKCHRHPQLSCTPSCFLLVGFLCLCNLFIPSPNSLSNHASRDLFSSLSLTFVDANLFIHPCVSFLFSCMRLSSTRTGARCCVSCFPLYLWVLSHVYLLNPDENTKLKYPVLSLITVK